MSADVLRRAAAAMRSDCAAVETDNGEDDPFMFAVADWLDDALEAHLHVRAGNYPSYLKAVEVARAYLNEPAAEETP